jgi:hypothetical protein
MKRLTRVAAAFIGALVLLGVLAGPSAAGPPVKVGECELIVDGPGSKDVHIPICQNGPPIQ